MLHEQRLRVVQLIKGDVYLKILLRQSHVLIHLSNVGMSAKVNTSPFERVIASHLQRIVKIAHVTQGVEELIHPSLVVVHKRIQAHHICLFGI